MALPEVDEMAPVVVVPADAVTADLAVVVPADADTVTAGLVAGAPADAVMAGLVAVVPADADWEPDVDFRLPLPSIHPPELLPPS